METCTKCGVEPPTGQRLWPATRRDPATGKYGPQRLCIGCLTENDPKPKFTIPPRTTHGTRAVGSMMPGAKMTEKEVRQLRALAATGKFSQRQLAERFGINQSTANAILGRRRWRHVND